MAEPAHCLDGCARKLSRTRGGGDMADDCGREMAGVNINQIRVHREDLPKGYDPGDVIAVDTETMGLNMNRDRLCLVQLSTGDGTADIVQITSGQCGAPVLQSVLENHSVIKLFHFARFDIAALKKHLGASVAPVYCTKIASRLVRTYTDQHGLKALCRELLKVSLDKEQQSSDWGTDELTQDQLRYAALDVIHLHQLKDILDRMLAREGRTDLAEACFNFLPVRARIDLQGWENKDIFAH